MAAAVSAVEALDNCVKRIADIILKHGGQILLTADHGNADVMLEKNKKGQYQVRTAHSLSPVPFVIYGWNGELRQEGCGLSNVAATVAELLELPVPEMWEKSLISH